MQQNDKSFAASTDGEWIKAGRSNKRAFCVELLLVPGEAAMVRDSKDLRADAPILTFSPVAWQAFLNHLNRVED
ncbi:DUF397 domain-containing protein [Amycolatopsis sp. DG1A-15b]|uniref:DUF397 domain-containing protein n=1 Tax=Amycolatopsis sp. DG1A-15b TaxID=3052846 RepID=UPI00255BDCA8|nr:DUF397 domain-containing protein [Amycolatopsis sp. DG1A-15b]WIX88166.1 DUF397 domain-containing protein [Amycolatopsis sp. DG1A-15b]